MFAGIVGRQGTAATTCVSNVGQVGLGRWVHGSLHHLRTAGHLGSSAHQVSEDGLFFSL